MGPRQGERDLNSAPKRRLPAGLINQSLRENHSAAGLAWRLAAVVRAINAVREIRGRKRKRSADANRFPPGGVTYRGGGFDSQYRGFFSVGKKYRVPGFLATSFDQSIAIKFRDVHAFVPAGGERGSLKPRGEGGEHCIVSFKKSPCIYFLCVHKVKYRTTAHTFFSKASV